MESTFKKKYTRFVPLLAVGIIAAAGAAHAGFNSPRSLNWNSKFR
jgi:hypothetical protein